NSTTGEIRAFANDALRFSGPYNANSGKFNMAGGLIEFTGSLNNNSTGLITGRGQLMSGGSGINNAGTISLSGGLSDIYGLVTNTNKITITGGSTTPFYNAVTGIAGRNLRIDANSSAVFLANVSVS